MTPLAHYFQTSNESQASLAAKVGVSPAQISRVASEATRPSAGLAKRIQEATNGAVSAAGLLGVAEAPATFDNDNARRLSDGRWTLSVADDGSVLLSPRMVTDLGFVVGERLTITPEEDHIRLHSADKALERIQAQVRALVPEGVSLVDELIAERRAEAARE